MEALWFWNTCGTGEGDCRCDREADVLMQLLLWFAFVEQPPD
ncbi:hypothetical protein LMG28688_06627 [Paraburkholderia caffeinitolerans]|uniref:Uncharacterized protein n=1 Tax=Paraburkholderia caffeinitolerans TaxID=1723730 RepID=A0A6J5GVK7_9BURK|nr:hypothetical protein LMG28688_06627 [Paraburkholderia caffeinitolerans]